MGSAGWLHERFPSGSAERHFTPELAADSTAWIACALKQWGEQSSAYFMRQSGVAYFTGREGGVISYLRQPTPFGAIRIVMTNPLCPERALAEFLREFEQSTRDRILYAGVCPRVAEVLARQGWQCNVMGTEFSVDLSRFTLQGRDKKQLRHAANLGDRFDLRVVEERFSAPLAAASEQLSQRWRAQKRCSGRELRLLTRPPRFEDEWLVRRFFAYQGDTLLGYIFFDPCFRGGRIDGYCANILRTEPQVQPAGLLDHILLTAIRTFQQEGHSRLSLGISPLHGLHAWPGERRDIRRLCEWIYRHGNGLYAFRNLAYHKSRYRGTETPWLLCTRGVSLMAASWALLRGTAVL